MKKITSAVLGFSLALATAGLTFAAQATPAPAATDKAAAPAPVTKKHVKKHKKDATAPAAATTSNTAPAAKPAK
jgi:hypothetical protein